MLGWVGQGFEVPPAEGGSPVGPVSPAAQPCMFFCFAQKSQQSVDVVACSCHPSMGRLRHKDSKSSLGNLAILSPRLKGVGEGVGGVLGCTPG